jgi:predicted phage tail protein
MEFVQGIGDQLAQGQASSVTLYNLAQFFKQRGAEDTQDYNKLVVDQVQQLVQVNQQLMSKLSRLESDKQQFLENQNNIEQSTREQIHDLSKKLESSNGIIDELQKQVHEKHRQMTAMRTDCETQLNQLHQNVQDLLAEKAHMSEMIQHNHSKVAQEQIQTQSLQQEYDCLKILTF